MYLMHARPVIRYDMKEGQVQKNYRTTHAFPTRAKSIKKSQGDRPDSQERRLARTKHARTKISKHASTSIPQQYNRVV